MPDELRGRVAWIVGASGTIGRAVAEALAREEATIVLSSRSQTSLDSMAASLEDKYACGAKAISVDIGSRHGVDAAAEAITREFGRIDLLVNTTSISRFGDFIALSDQDWLDVYQSKFFAYLRTIRAAIPHMLRQEFGRIVNVSGRGGHQPTLPVHLPGMSANASVNF